MIKHWNSNFKNNCKNFQNKINKNRERRNGERRKIIRE